eukprot:6208475-Pleurochrysis_carterae.AAC.2
MGSALYASGRPKAQDSIELHDITRITKRTGRERASLTPALVVVSHQGGHRSTSGCRTPGSAQAGKQQKSSEPRLLHAQPDV